MRSFALFVLGTLALGGVARAQSAGLPPQSKPDRGYVEGVAQSSFGNVTSQSFGAEIGVTVVGDIQVFADVGYARDTAPAELGTSAQVIAGFLSQTQANVTFRGKQPVTFGLAGIRYRFPTSSGVEPYVQAGGGIAQVKKDVSFSIAGTDVTSNLAQYGVVLGTDLSGTETSGMVGFGVGVAWSPWQNLVIDFQYRFGRVFTSDNGLNLNRAGVGIGVRF
jgi:opacity protein-like surface antigen